MILIFIVALPIAAGALAWWAERLGPQWPRWIALIATAGDVVLAIALWQRPPLSSPAAGAAAPAGAWLADVSLPWIPRFGIGFHLAADGLTVLMIGLTGLLGMAAVACSWREVNRRTGFFHFNLLWSIAGALGVFAALDLFLFFFFWEVMLVPMYFLIALWGHERRWRASLKFFLFTQGSGLLMLAAIVALAVAGARMNGRLSFDYAALLHLPLPPAAALWIMLGFFVAFAVKLPAVPLHTWLPDAHTEAPTAGSVILAGVMLKTGAYGLLRFAVPLFPDAAMRFAPFAMALGVLGILYGAIVAFSQQDLKRLVAYTSVSHMGFVLLGVYAWNGTALNGAVLQMVAHGLSTGALFVLVGMLQERLHTRDLDRMGGLWATVPGLSAMGLFLAVASLGMPGLINFVGEFLVLLGAFARDPWMAAAATLGLIAAAAYALLMVQRAFHGDNARGWQLPDWGLREKAVLASLAVLIAVFGVFPQPLLNQSAAAIVNLQRAAPAPGTAGATR